MRGSLGRCAALRLLRAFAVLATATAVMALSPFHPVDFEDFSERLPPFESKGGWRGAAVLDLDNDGKQDLYLPSFKGQKEGLFRNLGNNQFEDISAKAGLSGTDLSLVGAVSADFDNDGNADILTVGTDLAIRFYRNKGDGTFEDVSAESGIVPPEYASSICVSDVNKDGYLDVFITSRGPPMILSSGYNVENKLFISTGAAGRGLKFIDGTAVANIGRTNSLGAVSCAFADYNGDGNTDLILVNGNTIPNVPQPIALLKNDGKGHFSDVTGRSQLDGQRGYFNSIGLADIDNDGDLDIFLTNMGMSIRHRTALQNIMDSPNFLLMNNGDGSFHDGAYQLGVAPYEFGVGVSSSDYNNDGRVDFFYSGASNLLTFVETNPGRLFFNAIIPGWMQTIHFKESSEHLHIDLSNRLTSGVVSADFDNDGFKDILIISSEVHQPNRTWEGKGEPIYLHNKGGNKQNWITISLQGTDSNRDGVGARVTMYKGTTDTPLKTILAYDEMRIGSSFASSEGKRLHFGLGDKTHVNFKISWPSGKDEFFVDVAANKHYHWIEGTNPVQVKDYEYEFFDLSSTWLNHYYGWACPKCHTFNDPEAHTCGGCGAHRPEGKEHFVDAAIDSHHHYGHHNPLHGEEDNVDHQDLEAAMRRFMGIEQHADEGDDGDYKRWEVPHGFDENGQPADPNWILKDDGTWIYKSEDESPPSRDDL